jgi:hypothetical protein
LVLLGHPQHAADVRDRSDDWFRDNVDTPNAISTRIAGSLDPPGYCLATSINALQNVGIACGLGALCARIWAVIALTLMLGDGD